MKEKDKTTLPIVQMAKDNDEFRKADAYADEG